MFRYKPGYATRLALMKDDMLWIYCACGYSAPVYVRDVLVTHPHLETLCDLLVRTRCTACGVKAAVQGVTSSWVGRHE